MTRIAYVAAVLAAAASLAGAPPAGAAPASTRATPKRAPAVHNRGTFSQSVTPVALATFAGGCFWCMETAFEGIPGVTSVVSGFSGGPEKSPTYQDVSAGRTGHLEAVQVVYDPRRISYAKLLEIFWHNIDPTQGDGQFCDRGNQYRSAVFVRSPEERRLAQTTMRAAQAEIRIRKVFATRILPFQAFWPAEEYHQDYYRKNPADYHSYRAGCGRDQRLRALWGKVPHAAG